MMTLSSLHVICVIIGSRNPSVKSKPRPYIINTALLSSKRLGTNLSEFWIKMYTFIIPENASPAKCR